MSTYFEYVNPVIQAVYKNDQSIGVRQSTHVGNLIDSPFELLFRDADGDFFVAEWRNGLVIDEDPFEERTCG